MRRVKASAGKDIKVLLDTRQAAKFDDQRGLNDRQFWKRSFRSVVVPEGKMFAQKVWYIHNNPVKANLCKRPAEYRWSSACLFEGGCWDDEKGLSIEDWLRLAPPA